MANKLISLSNLTRYHQKLLSKYDARVIANAPSGGDDAAYLETLFAQGRVILRPKAHYNVGRTIILPEGTDVEMNGATIEYIGDNFDNTPGHYRSGCAFLNVNDPHPASASDPDRAITKYNGRGNMRFRNGTFLNCAFGFLHSHDVSFEDCFFGEIYANGHVFQLAACKNFSFYRCTFCGVSLARDNVYSASGKLNDVSTEVINLDISTETGQFIDTWFIPKINNVVAPTWDEYACREITVDHCIFKSNNDSLFQDAIGYHANWMQPYDGEVENYDHINQVHKHIHVTNNYIYGQKRSKTSGHYNTEYTVAFKIRHMMYCIFANNICENVQSLFEADHVRNVTVCGNVIQGNGNGARAFVVDHTWHDTTRGDNKQFLTVCKNLNIAGNMCDGDIVNNQTLIGPKVMRYFSVNGNTTDPVIDSAVFTNKTQWTANTDSYPRYSKNGTVTTLHGRVNCVASLTLTPTSNSELLTLPESCRPASVVTWVGRGETWDNAGNLLSSFPVFLRITPAGVLSVSAIDSNVNLTTGSQIWIDGIFSAINNNYSSTQIRDTPSS